MHVMSVLGYLAKLKRDLRLTFGAHSLHDFSIKMFHILIFNQWTKFISINVKPYFFLKILNKMLLSSYLYK